jgi:hypothetical protein
MITKELMYETYGLKYLEFLIIREIKRCFLNPTCGPKQLFAVHWEF